MSTTTRPARALKALSRNPQRRFVAAFSVLFNERVDFLPQLISNFLLHVPDAALVINASAPTLEACMERHAHQVSEPRRVFLLRADRPRSHWGATLMLAHLSSYRAARESLKFTHFGTLASNSLFTHPLQLQDCIEALAQAPSQHQPGYPYPGPDNPDQRALFPAFHNLLRPEVDKLYPNEIEGFFTGTDNWDLMLGYEHRLVELQAAYEKAEPGVRLAVEEFFPAQVVCGLGDKRFINVHTRWFDANSYTPHIKRQVSVNGLLALGAQPRHQGVKWFTRHPEHPMTVSVCEPETAQLLHQLQQLCESASPARQMALYALAMGLSEHMAQQLLQAGRQHQALDALALPEDWRFDTIEPVDRQWREIPMGGPVSYLFHEKLPGTTTHLQFAHVRQSHRSAMQVRVRVNSDLQRPTASPRLLSFWYLPLSLPVTSRSLSLTLQIHNCNTSDHTRDQLFKYCALLHQRAFTLLQATAHDHGRYLFCIQPEREDSAPLDDQVRIGIALHENVEFTFSIEVHVPSHSDADPTLAAAAPGQ